MGLFSRNYELSDESKPVFDNVNDLYRTLTSEFPNSDEGSTVITDVKSKRISEEEFGSIVRDYIQRNYSCSDEVTNEAIVKYTKFISSYSILTDLIRDPSISDIKTIAYDNVRIKRLGKRETSNVKFDSLKDYKAFIDFVTTKNHVNASQRNSIQRFTDNETDPDFILRFTLSMETTNTYPWPILAIRKVPKDFPSIEELATSKAEGGPEMMSKELKDVLVKRFNEGGTLICGANSSGKTTILNAIKETIPNDKSVFIIQQADELTTKSHPEMIFMHSLPGVAEADVNYGLKEISIASLTFDVDFIIIGETKGDEALDLLKAVYSGQLGATTVHAPNARVAIHKICDYALSSPDNHYTKTELMRMLGDSFKTIIYMKDFKVNQVVAVQGYNESNQDIDYYSIFENGTLNM